MKLPITRLVNGIFLLRGAQAYLDKHLDEKPDGGGPYSFPHIHKVLENKTYLVQGNDTKGMQSESGNQL